MNADKLERVAPRIAAEYTGLVLKSPDGGSGALLAIGGSISSQNRGPKLGLALQTALGKGSSRFLFGAMSQAKLQLPMGEERHGLSGWSAIGLELDGGALLLSRGGSRPQLYLLPSAGPYVSLDGWTGSFGLGISVPTIDRSEKTASLVMLNLSYAP